MSFDTINLEKAIIRVDHTATQKSFLDLFQFLVDYISQEVQSPSIFVINLPLDRIKEIKLAEMKALSHETIEQKKEKLLEMNKKVIKQLLSKDQNETIQMLKNVYQYSRANNILGYFLDSIIDALDEQLQKPIDETFTPRTKTVFENLKSNYERERENYNKGKVKPILIKIGRTDSIIDITLGEALAYVQKTEKKRWSESFANILIFDCQNPKRDMNIFLSFPFSFVLKQRTATKGQEYQLFAMLLEKSKRRIVVVKDKESWTWIENNLAYRAELLSFSWNQNVAEKFWSENTNGQKWEIVYLFFEKKFP